MNRFLLAFFVAILPGILVAQDSLETRLVDYSYGLRYNFARKIAKDAHGYVWLATGGTGVVRWDGSQTIQLNDSLQYSYIMDIDPQEEGMWVAAFDGLYLVTHKISPTQFKDGNTLAQEIHYVWSNNTQTFAISTEGTVFSVNSRTNTIERQLQVPEVKNSEYKAFKYADSLVVQNSKGRFFNIVKLNNDAFYTGYELAENSLEPRNYFSDSHHLYFQQGNSIYFGNGDKLFTAPTQEKIHWMTHKFGYVWLKTAGGVFRYVEKNSSLVEGVQVSGAADAHAFEDERYLWVSTYDGVLQIGRSLLTYLSDPEPNYKTAYFNLEIVKNQLWGASITDGIHIFEDFKRTKVLRFKNDAENRARSILSTDSTVFYGSNNGLMELNHNGKVVRRYDQIKVPVTSLEKFGKYIAVGTRGFGLYLIDKKGNLTYLNKRNGLTDGRIWILKAVQDQLFIGTEQGLFAFDGQNFRYHITDDKFKTIPVTALALRNKTELLVGSWNEGVLLCDLTRGKVKSVISTSDGLISNNILFLEKLGNSIWVGSDGGVDLIEDFDKKSVLQLSQLDQRFGAETSLSGSIVWDKKIILSTIRGTLALDTSFVPKKREQKVHIDAVEILSINEDSEIGPYNVANTVKSKKAPFTHGNVTFTYSIANLQSQKRLYQYRLLDYEDEFSIPTSDQSITYKQVPPGKYRFQVKAFNNPTITEMTFVVGSPFYLRIEYQVLMFAFLLGLVTLAWKLQSRRKIQRALNNEKIRQEVYTNLRKEMAIDFHDELGNHIAKIINYVSILKIQGLKGDQDEIASKIQHSAKELFSAAKELIWSLKTDEDTIDELFLHVRDFFEQCFDDTDINFRVYKEGDLSNFTLSSKKMRDLSMIMKEAATNVMAHSKAKNVNFKVFVDEKNVATFQVSDDGCGFDDKALVAKRGLSHIEQRSVRSGFKYKVESSPNSGTTITITFTPEPHD